MMTSTMTTTTRHSLVKTRPQNLTIFHQRKVSEDLG